MPPDAYAAWPVALVSMPFMDAGRPSIQLGLLKEILRQRGFPVRTVHANLDLAARVGVDVYRRLAEHRGRMVGDWLFSLAAFGDDAPDQDGDLLADFADDLAYLRVPGEVLLDLRHHQIPAFLDGLADELDRADLRVVAFTTTFQQSVASFALARRLKARRPDLVTVFGGANFDGEMGPELVRTIDWVDIAVIGEGDVALPALLSALATGGDVGSVPGVARRVDGTVVVTPPAAPLEHLDALPTPDYAEYFDRAERLGVLPREAHRSTWIPFESARGCWWGASHHCTFCGLNGTTMRFRAKSPARVLQELADQARRYRSFRFTSVDNILDAGYLRTLLPALAEAATDYELFYEVKANLTREHLRLMARGGLRHIQPGIESLNTNVLRLMRKGVTAAQNVNVLRWARYYGITVAWNILWGFPGETAQAYAEQAAIIPHLVHLQPPANALRIWMERFSPLYADASSVRWRRPERSYRYVYPSSVDLDRVAYFFEYELEDALPDEAYAGVRREVDRWAEAYPAPRLTYWSAPGLLQIYDGRWPGREGTYTFRGDLAAIYLACADRARTASAVREHLRCDLSIAAIQEAFVEYERRGLMLLDGSLALALALPATPGR